MKHAKYPTNWAEIRKNVLERDSYTCQHCGCAEGEARTSHKGNVYKAALQVAHLDHDPENWSVSYDRLLSLCQSCHLKNDRERSEELMKAALSGSRVKQESKGGLTKPQMKTIISSLTKKIAILEQQVLSRDLKIQEIITALSSGQEMIGKLNEIITTEKLNQYSRYSWRL